MTMIQFAIDLMGWSGAIGILVAYHWSSSEAHREELESPSGKLKYQSLNILGAIGLLANSFYYGATPSVIVNLIWLAIAARAILAMPFRGALQRG